jgi:hypothetical protein
VTEEFPEPDHAPVLRALGRVDPPAPAVVEAARERLWSAVAGEMLATRPADGPRRNRTAGTDRPRQRHRRHGTEPGR